jgi:hypothetical protein
MSTSPYGEPISARISDLLANSAAYAERANTGLGCALATNSVYTNKNYTVPPGLAMGGLAADASAGPITITLPLLSDGDNTVEISKIDATANTVTVICQGADLCVGGGTSVILTAQSDFTIVYTSSQLAIPVWVVMAARIGGFPPPPTAASAVAALASAVLNTVNNVAANYTIQASDTIVSAAAASSNVTITLPSATAGPRRLEIHKSTPYQFLNHTVIVQCYGSETIIGSGAASDSTVSSVTLTYKGDFIVLVASGLDGVWLCSGSQLG